MSLALNEGGSYAPTGGAAISFDRTGESIANGVVLGNMSEADFFAREKLYATSRMPALQGDGEYSKQKVSIRIVRPMTLASGKVVYNLVRVETEIHPEATAAEGVNLRSLGLSALSDTDLSSFWSAGSLNLG
jgi:hypothetical protein